MSRSGARGVGGDVAVTSAEPSDRGAPDAATDGMKVALAEFDALRDEIVSARTAQGAVLGAGLTVLAVILTVTFNNLEQSGQSRLLAAIPPLSLLVTLLNLSQSIRIHRIGEYIRVTLWPYLQERTGYPHSWEQEHSAGALRTALLFDSAPVGLLLVLAVGSALYSWSAMGAPGRATGILSIGLLVTVQTLFVLGFRRRGVAAPPDGADRRPRRP